MKHAFPLHRPLCVWLACGAALAAMSCAEDEQVDPVVLYAQQQPIETATIDELNDALGLFSRSASEQFTYATDLLERGETLIFPETLGFFVQEGDFTGVFTLGDEAFEAERDRVFGMGVGVPPPLPRPVPTQRLQIGEIGGVDSTSCRSCHFNGGADGSGTLTQVGLFRSDGRHLSSATLREAPHVMGLGYISLVARKIEAAFERKIFLEGIFAESIGEPVPVELSFEGIFFAQATVFPDGSFTVEDTTHITSDLIVRPFGFKGRHDSLVPLVDEALQLHHGLQSTARMEIYADEPETYLGDGDDFFDRDNDGVQGEATAGQSALLASYMSMLSVPSIKPPSNPELALVWARGQRLFGEVGCATCHVPSLRFDDPNLEINVLGRPELDYAVDLDTFGQEPRPINVDYAPDDTGSIPTGVPIFAFTDFRRHDMGPELAEPNAEVLPDGSGEVAGSVWLTRPLWGLADTAPYLHDGRAPTVHDAIVWHGGESSDSREAYLALNEDDRGALRVFLMSLTREGGLLVE